MPQMIFIENLYPKIDVTDLCKEFGKFGRILSAKIDCGRNFISLCKGHICYFDSTSAEIAVKEMNGKRNKLGSSIQVGIVKFDKKEKQVDVPKVDDSKIFINNLDPEWDECDIIKIFKVFGEIDEVKISDTDGKSNGYGYVKFAEPVSAKRAIKEQNNIPDIHRKIIVEPFIPWAIREEARKSLDFAKVRSVEWNNLHIKNIDKDATEEDLKELFQPYGTILSVKIPVNEAGKSKGFGFVCFEKEEDAAKAQRQMDNYEYRFKRLEINFNQKKQARQNYLKTIKTDPQIREFKGGKESV